MKNKNSMIKEIDIHLQKIKDLRKEYIYWNKETTQKNFLSILKGYEALLKGNRVMLRRM